MVFKRREKRTVLQTVQDTVYPRGGWGRAASYISYRLRRLPDTPQKIARGIAAGIFVSFSPFFGFHFVYSVIVALLIRGNVVAAILATFAGNPITFPAIAAISIYIGEWMLQTESPIPLSKIFHAFSRAFAELWHNIGSVVTGEPAHWDRLLVFFEHVFLPYLVGGVLPGLLAGFLAYFASKPLIAAYQSRREKRLKLALKSRIPTPQSPH